MPDATFTCPRCLRTSPLAPDARYCPHCGLPGAQESAAAEATGAPAELRGQRWAYRVFDRFAVGSIATLYRCHYRDGAQDVSAILKVARDPRANPLITNEADVLRRLRAADAAAQFAPFLPSVEETIDLTDAAPGSIPRSANVLRLDPAIRSPAELYTLTEVRTAYPAGLDPRDAAWIWRRILNVLGFVHAHGVIHGAVLPMHVLIEPLEHKLVVVDWCCAVRQPWHVTTLATLAGGPYARWYKREYDAAHPPSVAIDIALAARSMIELLGGDPLDATGFPATVDPALRRYFQRCLASGGPASARPAAWKLLEDFDHLIEVLWGERNFRPLALPPKSFPQPA